MEPDELELGQPKTRLPGADDAELDEDERRYRADDAGAVKDVDPEVAAKRRAARRQQARAAAAASLTGVSTDLPEDVAEAEEDDPDEAVGYNEAGEPIPLEPFNLLREREEGYFDEEGHYVEYRLPDVLDAWLEQLDGADGGAQASDRTPARKRPQAALLEPQQLDEEDVAVYKSRIAACLRPGETVLQALRRLARMDDARQQQQQQQLRSGRRGRRGRGGQGGGEGEGGRAGEQGVGMGDEEEGEEEDAGPGNEFTCQQQGKSGERQRMRRVLRQQQQQEQQQSAGQQQQEKQSSQQQQGPESNGSGLHSAATAAGPTSRAKAVEAAALMLAAPVDGTLQATSNGGSVGVPAEQEPQQQQRQQAAPAPALGPSDSSGAGSCLEGQAGASGLDRRSPGQAGGSCRAPRRASSPRGSSPRRGAPVGTAGRHHHSLGPDRRVPVENSIEFDKLTEYADLLLGQSDFDVYNKTKEQLLQEARGGGSGRGARAASGGTAATGGGMALPVQGVPQPAAAGSAGEGDAGAGALGVSGAASSSEVAAAAAPAGLVARVGRAAAGPTAGQDDDMFGDEFALPAALAAASGASLVAHGGQGAVGEVGGRAGDAAGAVPELATAAQAGSTAGTLGAGQDPGQDQDQEMGASVRDPTSGPSSEDATGDPMQAPPVAEAGGDGSVGEDAAAGMQGFVLDPGSGLLYNSDLGYYFDPMRQVWRDAATGLYYRVGADGQYVQVQPGEEEQMEVEGAAAAAAPSEPSLVEGPGA